MRRCVKGAVAAYAQYQRAPLAGTRECGLAYSGEGYTQFGEVSVKLGVHLDVSACQHDVPQYSLDLGCVGLLLAASVDGYGHGSLFFR